MNIAIPEKAQQTVQKTIKTTAHRGASSLAPENTLAAFMKAAELGCDWIEIDVQLSLDKVPMVIHDRTVDRCSNGSGAVAELALSSLKQLDAGQWFGQAFTEERIPTLAETLCLAKKNNLKVNIELKLYPQDDVQVLCERISEVITESQCIDTQLLFSSFNAEALKRMQNLQPQIRRGQLWEKIPTDALANLKEIDAYSVHCDYRFLTERQAQQLKQSDYQLYCYTPNQPALVEQHWGWGVDMMITDKPQAYRAILAYAS
ncbi:glycerophosphoryl diester phosphodiesterase [Psychromonas marina]|uniref:Glycerophosphoryl diester phosphodiesterase n=1 Tax=Psychromonas marina TaxID=88364 RepID=A0ABQ6E1Q7_9GAMM|nr:glycerophosphoryl diester phosphodiesterase [Psychromonas marina]GLS90961.1 glycerophosphoryl diester phosphodiesterase [Psychromonas marina]